MSVEREFCFRTTLVFIQLHPNPHTTKSVFRLPCFELLLFGLFNNILILSEPVFYDTRRLFKAHCVDQRS